MPTLDRVKEDAYLSDILGTFFFCFSIYALIFRMEFDIEDYSARARTFLWRASAETAMGGLLRSVLDVWRSISTPGLAKC